MTRKRLSPKIASINHENGVKFCPKCEQTLPLEKFGKAKSEPTGHQAYCKSCKKAYINDEDRKIRYSFKSIDQRLRCQYAGTGRENHLTIDDLRFLWERDKARDMERPSLDRIDNDGHYILENCRFVELSINAGKDKQKPVIQMNMDGEFIKEYPSARIAADALGTIRHSISNAARGYSKSSMGYKWKYKSDV